MPVTSLSTEEEYNEFIKSKELSVIHFFASWAPQCTQMNEILDEMTSLDDYKNVKFGKIVAEDVPEISSRADILAVPTVLLFKNSCIIDRIDGIDSSALKEKIKEHSLLCNVTQARDITLRLKDLINQSPCMLFMKGNPTTPRCGFSRTVIGILDSYRTNYQTFDILQDNEVREGLKKLSDWPTYPQLYLNGELIGGLDIIKEMCEAGELEPMLPKKPNLETRIFNVIKRSKVVVVAKGTKNNPKCLYTKKIMKLLDDLKIRYETFDVLTDKDLRIALTIYSNWPSYPQVYVDGKLLGGFKTIEDLYKNNELVHVLNSTNIKKRLHRCN